MIIIQNILRFDRDIDRDIGLINYSEHFFHGKNLRETTLTLNLLIIQNTFFTGKNLRETTLTLNLLIIRNTFFMGKNLRVVALGKNHQNMGQNLRKITTKTARTPKSRTMFLTYLLTLTTANVMAAIQDNKSKAEFAPAETKLIYSSAGGDKSEAEPASAEGKLIYSSAEGDKSEAEPASAEGKLIYSSDESTTLERAQKERPVQAEKLDLTRKLIQQVRKRSCEAEPAPTKSKAKPTRTGDKISHSENQQINATLEEAYQKWVAQAEELAKAEALIRQVRTRSYEKMKKEYEAALQKVSAKYNKW